MRDNIVCLYKDAEPLTTIISARDKLATCGMIAQELWHHVGAENFSVHLSILGTTLTANGKGCTKDLALASAYAMSLS